MGEGQWRIVMDLPPIPEFKFGFFSPLVFNRTGTAGAYKTIEGTKVMVTDLSDDVEGKDVQSPDKEFMGMVVIPPQRNRFSRILQESLATNWIERLHRSGWNPTDRESGRSKG